MLTICALLRGGADLVVLRPARRPRGRAGQDRDARAAPRSSSRSTPARSPPSTSTNGDRVKAGDLLLELDPAEAMADATAQRDALNAEPGGSRAPALRDRDGARGRKTRRERRRRPRTPPTHRRSPRPPRGSASRRSPGTTGSPEAFRLRERAVLAADLVQLADALEQPRQADGAEGGDARAPQHEHRVPGHADRDADRSASARARRRSISRSAPRSTSTTPRKSWKNRSPRSPPTRAS